MGRNPIGEHFSNIFVCEALFCLKISQTMWVTTVVFLFSQTYTNSQNSQKLNDLDEKHFMRVALSKTNWAVRHYCLAVTCHISPRISAISSIGTSSDMNFLNYSDHSNYLCTAFYSCRYHRAVHIHVHRITVFSFLLLFYSHIHCCQTYCLLFQGQYLAALTKGMICAHAIPKQREGWFCLQDHAWPVNNVHIIYTYTYMYTFTCAWSSVKCIV